MRHVRLIGMSVALVGALSACSSSKSGTKPGDPSSDGGSRAGAAKDAATPERVLVTFGGAMTSELVAVNVATKAIDGRLKFPGFGIVDTENTSSPWLLEQDYDVLARLGARKPWSIDATWSVAMMDAVDGGQTFSDPVQVVEVGTTAYVLRYQRNQIGVVTATASGDAGSPSSDIELSGYLQPSDPDGLVDMTAAAYVESSHRLYIVLGGVNQLADSQYGGVICAGTIATVVAIDTQTNALVSLGGTGPKGSIVLTYVNPLTVVYDSAGDRLLVVGAGCYAQPAGPGDSLASPSHGGVEAVNLGTGATTSLLDFSAISFPMGFVDLPTGFAYIDSTHAILGFDQTGQAVYEWDPTTKTLGSLIRNAPDIFAYDGNGHLLGSRVELSSTGVPGATDIVSVTIANGDTTTLASGVTSLTGHTYVAAVGLWPHP